MGSKTQTSTNQSTTTPVNTAGLQSIFDKVQSAASTPYTPYGGELTAGINGQQTTGINNTNAAAGVASPFYNSASTLAGQAGAPLSQAAIQSYLNPYTQNVINSTQANFNEGNGIQQQQVKGSAALAGALGGDRQAVAQSETARQQQLAQAPVIAGLQQQNYTQAVQAAQADRSAAGSAAGLYGNLGTGAQTAALQGAGAQIGAGTLQQNTQQAGDTAQYQQYLQAQGFPYQQAQFFAQYGLPAATAQGSTTNGSTTTPGPNPYTQAAGLGLTAAGLFLKDGGRVGYADGGSPTNFFDAQGFIPKGQPISVSPLRAPAAPQQSAQAPQNPFAPVTSALGGMKGKFKSPGTPDYGQDSNMMVGGYSMPTFGTQGGGSYDSPLAGLSSSDYDMPGADVFKAGGLVHAIHAIHHTIKHSRGGAVSASSPLQPFATGGRVAYADGGTSFDDRFSAAYPAQDPPADQPDQPFRLAGPKAMDDWRSGADTPNPAVVADASALGGPAASPVPANPMRRAAALPPEITGPAPSEDEPSSAMAYDGAPRNPMLLNGSPDASAEAPQQQFGKSLFGVNLSDKTRQALVAAGLGIAASKSPFAMTALGEGGLQGLKTYSEVGAADREAADKKISQTQNQRRVDMEAQRIAQSAEQFAKTNKLAERRQTFAEDKTPEGYRATNDGKSYEPIPGGPADPETIRKTADAKGTKYIPAGSIMGDDGTLRPAVMDQATGKIIDAVTGEPPKPTDKITPKGTKAPVSDEDAKALASYYVKTGDASRLNGMGITGEARQKVQHYVTEVQKAENVSDEELATRKAEWEGRKAGQRTLGVQEAKMGSAAFEAEGAIKQARGVIERLPRTSFLPMNQLIQGYQNKTLNPDQAELYGRAQAIVNTYSAVMARGANVTTDSARGHAEALLNTAANPEVFNRMLDTMLQEIEMAKHSPARMREFYRKQYGEKSIEGGAEPSGGTTAATSSGFKPPPGAIARTANGKTYYYDPDTKQPYPGQ